MRFQIKDKKYEIDFDFKQVPVVSDPSKKVSQTKCEIRRVYEKNNTVVEAVGYSTRNIHDQDNRVFGRKYAFTKALSGRFDKETRQMFWDFYKEHCRYKKV